MSKQPAIKVIFTTVEESESFIALYRGVCVPQPFPPSKVRSYEIEIPNELLPPALESFLNSETQFRYIAGVTMEKFYKD